jgi:membrane protease YdiL (CAAX protease family)
VASEAKKPEERTTAKPAKIARSGNPAVRAGSIEPRSEPPAPELTTPVESQGFLSRLFGAGPEDVPGLLPPDGAVYPQLLRTAQFAWWRSALGVLFGLSMFLLLTSILSRVVTLVAWTITTPGIQYAQYYTEAYAFSRPSGMLAANLGIAMLIPICWLLMTMVHQVAPRWLTSVQPGVRWRYLFLCLGIAVLALNGALLLSLSVSEPLDFGVQSGFWVFLIVILLTSPIQAAAEELFFRGYLMQALGSLVRQPWFGVIVSSVVFALLHGTQNLPLFVNRLAFGLLAAILVWRTGGLEAGIAAHVINNVFAYVIAGLTTSIATLRATREIDWINAAFDVGGFAIFAVLAYLLARRLKLHTQVDLSAVRPVA